MQYNLKEIEDKWKKCWEKNQTYLFRYDSGKPMYVVDTPPPYVSADHLHAGHIMSYTQAEFIVRFKRMNGYNIFYPMGFDDNGLPTERFVEKKYNIDKSKITRSEFIKICLKETEAGAKTYKELWSNLGISVDWTKTYSTISPLATRVSQWSLLDLYKKGLLYRDESPILWCTSCQTALAQADLEEQEESSKMNHINFLSDENTKLTIATTRPELLPACVALYVNPDDRRYKHLIGTKAQVPLFNYTVPIMASSEVEPELGTGLMMVCTWGDQEDLEKWRIDKLDTRILVNEKGVLSDLAGDFAGLKLKDARLKIIEKLKAENYLIKEDDITHTLKVHERCGTPIEFVLSKQWFIKVADNKDIWLEYAKKINWYPTEKKADYDLWVKSLKWDWCISRQRYYGVPLPIWYCGKCDEPIFAPEDKLPVNPIEDVCPTSHCPKCGNSEIIPEQGVMDTWATSSCTPFMIRELLDDEKIKEKSFPVNLRPNAFEIIRTWDFYSIVKSHYNFGIPPFKNIMIAGHGLDESGKKFSKRLGNYVSSDKLLELYSADALRYCATGATLGQNLRFNVSEVDKGKKTTIKLLNVANLIKLSKDEFQSTLEGAEYDYADVWILKELNNTIKTVTQYFESYSYAKAKDELDIFFWSKFTDYYLELIKYRLRGENIVSKNSAQATMCQVFLAILKMYAPILPFMTEELYHQLYTTDEADSIHLSAWVTEINIDGAKDAVDFNQAIQAIDEIRKYKSELGLSLGKELDEYTLITKINLDKYGEFIKSVLKIKTLIQN